MDKNNIEYHYPWWSDYAAPYFFMFGLGVVFVFIWQHENHFILYLFCWIVPLMRSTYALYDGIINIPMEVILFPENALFVFPLNRRKSVAYYSIKELSTSSSIKVQNVKLLFNDGSAIQVLATKNSEEFDPFFEELKKHHPKISDD